MAFQTTLSSRELNQDLGRAKRASVRGPVIITDRGKPAHVLLSFENYQKLTGEKRNIAEVLSSPESIDIDFRVPKLRISTRIAKFE